MSKKREGKKGGGDERGKKKEGGNSYYLQFPYFFIYSCVREERGKNPIHFLATGKTERGKGRTRKKKGRGG